MEVNEASCVIQEAAHEDANIIFGAVVDPTLAGKVKITVIATGFDRAGAARHIPEAARQTPVDLSNYAIHLSRPTPTAATVEQPAMEMNLAPASEQATPSITVSRRPGLELTLPGLEGAEGSSSLDIPAFLRRQS